MRSVSVNGLFTSVMFLGVLACVLSYLPFDWWLTDLLSHFRLQYALFFAVMVLVLAMLRYWYWVIAGVLLLGLNLTELVPRWLAVPQATPGQGQPLRLMTFNVNSRGDPQKALQVIQASQPDVLLLLEITQAWLQQLAPLTEAFPHQIVQPRTDNFGIALLSRYPIEGQVMWLGPARLPSVHAQVDLHGDKFEVWGTHPLPPMGRERKDWQDQQLTELVGRIQNKPLTIVAGDLNTTPYASNFKTMLHNSGLRDASLGFGIQGTWPLSFNVVSIPIDHVLHTVDIVTTEARVVWDTGSDHAAVVVDLIMPFEASSDLKAEVSDSI